MHVLHRTAAGHLGRWKLLAKFREWYTYLMDRKIAEEKTHTCAGCQQSTDYRSLMGRIMAEKPWHTASIDIMGPFEPCHEKRFVVSLIDDFSRYVISVPVADHTTTTVAKTIYCHLIAYFGIPAAMLSNQGAEFIGNIWVQLQAMIGCEMHHSSPYHIHANSVVERSHLTINNIV